MQCPRKILVIRLSSIGDILLTTPLLRVLHRQFPEAQIDFVVKKNFADLLRCHPAIHTLLSFDASGGWRSLWALRKDLQDRDYDLLVDIHNNWRSRFLSFRLADSVTVRYRKFAWQRFLLIHGKFNRYDRLIPVHRRYIDALQEWGVQDDGQGLHMELDPAVCQQMNTWMQAQGYRAGERQIGIAPGAGKATKRWPVESYSVLTQYLLRQKDVRIWLFGSDADRPAARRILQDHPDRVVDATGQFSLMQSACAIAAMQGLISNDSGLMHLATAVDCPVLAIFGPTTEEFGFFPQGQRTRVVQVEKLSCRPCSAYGSDRCPKGHFRCMQEILPQQVVNAARDFFLLADQ